MSIWLDRLAIVIGVAEVIASDTSTSKDIDDANVALASLDRALGDKTATMPAAGGPAAAVRSLHVLIVECLANQRDQPSRSRLRAATALAKEKWARELGRE